MRDREICDLLSLAEGGPRRQTVPSSGVNSDRARGAAGVERQDGRRCGQAGIETAGEPAHPLSSVEPQHRNSIGFARVSERPAATRSARASNVCRGGSHELNRLAFDHPPLVRGSVKPGGVGRDCPCRAPAPGMTIPATGNRRAAFS